jgi:tRNA(adenine34) deaminase
MSFSDEDKKWMKLALKEAKKAAQIREVPIGAVLVGPEGLISKAYNHRETWKTPIGHAEIIALHRGSKKLDNWRLTGTTLYVTLEPCVMCAGALVLARVDRVVFGALDPKGGGSQSLYTITEDKRLNHQVKVEGGLMADESAELLKSFFKMRRTENKNNT